MTTLRDILLAEARFQHSYAESDSQGRGPADGFVGLALLTTDRHVFGGHATSENYVAAASGALGSLAGRYKLAVESGEPTVPALEVADVVLVTSRNLDDINPAELAVLKEKLGLAADQPIGLRRVAKAAPEPALQS